MMKPKQNHWENKKSRNHKKEDFLPLGIVETQSVVRENKKNQQRDDRDAAASLCLLSLQQPTFSSHFPLSSLATPSIRRSQEESKGGERMEILRDGRHGREIRRECERRLRNNKFTLNIIVIKESKKIWLRGVDIVREVCI
uniref:Uncharacterized protein n=1 Tax=Caenorhabditis tropicalis TaxID=1561998 RepID=A0A1I7V308_9PELO